jgi:hypothetical protein
MQNEDFIKKGVVEGESESNEVKTASDEISSRACSGFCKCRCKAKGVQPDEDHK